MGKEINSGLLIMQCGDTDLILCLSTWADILMHSAPLLPSTQEVFTLCSKTEGGKTLPVWQRLHHCLNHLKTLTKTLWPRAGWFFFNFYYYYYFYCTVEIYFFIFTETLWMLSVSLTTAVDSGAHALKLNCEMLWQGTKKAPATYSQCTMGNGVCTWVWVQLTVNTDILHCTNTVYWFIQQQCGHFDVACSM